MNPIKKKLLTPGIIIVLSCMLSVVTLAQDTTKQNRLYFIRKAIGNLEIDNTASTDPYDIYFNVPVPTSRQVPLYMELDCPNLIDYRFIRHDHSNVVICARLSDPGPTQCYWTAWVMIGEDDYYDIPSFVPIPDTSEYPPDVKKWLQPTDLVQSNNQMIIDSALMVKGADSNMITIANKIGIYVGSIGASFSHSPVCFDAYYTLNWGNSCTGHAHLAAAMFRALGIPARSLQCIPVWFQGFMDMHWIIEYYVPCYGWVQLESTMGSNFNPSQSCVVNMISNPEDGFPLYFIGIDGHWHNSDPALGMYDPGWGGAHRSYSEGYVKGPDTLEAYIYELSRSVFEHYAATAGIFTNTFGSDLLENARNAQAKAIQAVTGPGSHEELYDSLIYYLEVALGYYEEFNVQELTEVFFEDFEGFIAWEHNGIEDEWEKGPPAYQNIVAHSGQHCYGTDLDDTYNPNADNWLDMPPVDLNGLSCAYFEFWVWNDVHDCPQGCAYDPLWLEISTDGGLVYIPYSSHMAGASDDPDIPKVGGWSKVVQDLTPYCGSVVKIRFRFSSDEEIEYAGSYIDNVRIYGREYVETYTMEDFVQENILNVKVYPNPATDHLNIQSEEMIEHLRIIDMTGKVCFKTAIEVKQIKIPLLGLENGVYVVEIIKEEKVSREKIVIQK